MHWADAELLHQAARVLDRRHRDLAALSNYHDGLIFCAAVSGAEDAEIAPRRWYHLPSRQNGHRAKPNEGGT